MARPLKFKSVKELQSKIDEYFESCYETVVIKHKKGKPVFNEDGTAQTEKRLIRPFTITGLALHLNNTHDMLLDYDNLSPQLQSLVDRYYDAETEQDCIVSETMYR